LFALCAGLAWGQESRGSITGKVTDPQGAVIPGAAVVVTNIETNINNRTVANGIGYFEVNLLNPGQYTIGVEAPGFKKFVRTGVELQVGSRMALEFQLSVGQLAETVEVTGAAPLLETTSATAGRVIDNKEVQLLPFSDMNPFALSALAPGMQWTGQPEYRRPFDNGGTSAFNTAGGVGSNEYMIDGAPVTGTGRRVGFVPPSDAVEEFKLETASFDAAQGHSSGAAINVMTKSGTNTFHGSLYDQHWQQRWNATSHFTRLAFENLVRQGKVSADSQRQAPGRSNQFGATIGGPVQFPKLFSGKDKLFFFFSYNGIYQKKAETTSSINRTVPRMAWRQGDFSDLQAIDSTKFTVYDPRTARTEGGRVVRTPFPGNKGVPVLNPVYKFYEPLYPKPNDVPGLVSAEGYNNYLGVAMPKDERFNSLVNRMDYNISERHRLFGRWYWNHRLADEYDWTYETKRGLHANGLTRINKGGGGDWVWTLSNSTILDLGASWTRFNEGAVNNIMTAYKPSDVGLPKYLDDKADTYKSLPAMSISGVEGVSGGYPAIGIRGTIGEVKLQLSTLQGSHTFKYGMNERRYWSTNAGPGTASGSFSFSNSYTRQADNTNTASDLGLSWAAFMMGLPSGISVATNDTAYWSTRYRTLYFQDDWRVSKRLRLNLGLRYEREGGTTERYNRGLAGNIDYNYKPVFADMAAAAYARNPVAEMPVSEFKIMGGVPYLGQPNKTFTDGTHHLLPRLGVVYQANGKTVIRGGYGWYFDTYNVTNDRPGQDGYSQGTSTTLTNDRGLTYCCGLDAVAGLSAAKNPMVDPFPVRADGTRFDKPYGNSLGQLIRQGRGWSEVPRDFSPAWQQRWRVGVQRELRADMVLEFSYNGAFARTPLGQTISYIPSKYWATGNTRNQAVEDFLNVTFPNPFNISNLAALQTSDPKTYNYLSTQGFFTGTTMRRNALIRAYPNLNGISGVRPGNNYADIRGRNKYHDFQAQYEKRFRTGFSMSVMYTYAWGKVQDYYENEFDTTPAWRVNNNLRPHRFIWSTIYELPFGKGRRWVNSSPIQHVIGGWAVSWIYQYQNGPATGWGNRFFYGDVNKIGDLFKHDEVNSKDVHMWFDPSIAYQTGSGAIPSGFVGFEGRSAMQPAGWQTRVFPTRLDVLREDGIRNWDVKVRRDFRVTERLRTNFSVDLLNATNHTNFSGPNTDPTSRNFGRVDTQRGLSRTIQFNLRIEF
jgi:hypothetical protein